MPRPFSRSIRRGGWVAGAAALLALIGAPGAMAQNSLADIQSAGPLTDIFIASNTQCQVAHTGEALFEFYSPSSQEGQCGTEVAVAGQLFGLGGSSWTELPQSGVTGSGTSADPFKVTTTVHALDSSSGSLLLTLVETDSYVVGTEFYRTDMTITNNTSTAQPVTLYHAADCYLQGSDSGYGFLDASNRSVACTQSPNNSPPNLVEEFSPLTPGNNYFEGDYYAAVYGTTSSQADYPNTCDCATLEDNGMGLNWDTTLAPTGSAGQSQTFSMVSNFSPTGVTALPISASGGSTFSGRTGTPVGGTLATFSADSSDVAGNFTATVDWGDGSSTAGTVGGSGGSFTVTGTHVYAAGGSFPITVTIVRTSNTQNRGTATDTAAITAPRVAGRDWAARRSTAARPQRSPDRSFPAACRRRCILSTGWTRSTPRPVPPARCTTRSTPNQPVGSDFSSHPVTASAQRARAERPVSRPPGGDQQRRHDEWP